MRLARIRAFASISLILGLLSSLFGFRATHQDCGLSSPPCQGHPSFAAFRTIAINAPFDWRGFRVRHTHLAHYPPARLLHCRWLLLADAGQSLLDEPCEFFLAGELDLRVFLSHPDRAVAGDFRALNARPTHLLPPRDVRASEGVRTQTWEIAALGDRRPL